MPTARNAVVLAHDDWYRKAGRDWTRLPDECADAIAAAVLAAADAGETEGPWRVERNLMTGRWWIVKPGKRAGMEEVLGSFADEPEARAVCNALNRVSALAGGGEA